MLPLVSVVIPTFNRRKFIADAVASALNQTYQNLEVVVVDDGSTDDTGKLLRTRFSTDARFRYLYQHNQERSRARNHGIRVARGKFIAFLDSDDLWAPTKIASQLEAVGNQPDVGMVVTWWEMFDESGKKTPIHCPSLDEITRADFGLLQAACNRIGSPTPLVGKEVLNRVGFFSEDINQGEDWDLWARVSLKTKVKLVPAVLAFRRIHSSNTERPMTPSEYLQIVHNILLANRDRGRSLRKAVSEYYAKAHARDNTRASFGHRKLIAKEWRVLGHGALKIWTQRLAGVWT